MSNVPKKVRERLSLSLKNFQPIVKTAKSRDVNESDTVTIITDMLSDMLGYDKYPEITREYCIRGTYCDLAVKIDNKLKILIEVKAIGIDLKEDHLKQAIGYAAQDGVEWIILTNGLTWVVYKVIFKQPVDSEKVLHFTLTDLNSRNESDIEKLFLISRESVKKSALEEFHRHKKATNKYNLAAIIVSNPVLCLIRRELRRLSPGLQIQVEDIEKTLKADIIKRDIMDDEQFKISTKLVKKVAKKFSKKSEHAKTESNTDASRETDNTAEESCQDIHLIHEVQCMDETKGTHVD